MGRDAERIVTMVDTLEMLWKKHPDMRLGQLLVNLTVPGETPLFYLEDGEVWQRMVDAMASGTWPHA